MEFPKIVDEVLPGLIGSIGAAFFIKGPPKRIAAMLVLGAAMAYYGAAYVAEKLAMNRDVASWLLGTFGMSVVDSIFKTWQERGLVEMVRGFVSAIRGGGQPPKE